MEGRKRACGLCGLRFKYTAILLVLILMCGCGRRASEPVLEPVPTAGGSFVFSGEGGQDSTAGGSFVLSEEGGQDSLKGAAEAGTEGGSEGSGYGNSESEAEIPQEGGASGELTVHVCGAVKKEGVYSLPEGSRISDAVEAAGGFDEKADTSFLNLAMKLEDSWQIRVPTVEEAKKLREKTGEVYGAESSIFTGGVRSAAVSGTGTVVYGESASGTGTEALNAENGSGSPEGGQKININTASEKELTKIPGVGESKAKRIVEYREQNGRFESIEDIMKVTGIKENSFRKMRDYITV